MGYYQHEEQPNPRVFERNVFSDFLFTECYAAWRGSQVAGKMIGGRFSAPFFMVLAGIVTWFGKWLVFSVALGLPQLQNLLAQHMKFEGQVPIRGAIKIGASVEFSFNVLKDLQYTLLRRTNGVSIFKQVEIIGAGLFLAKSDETSSTVLTFVQDGIRPEGEREVGGPATEKVIHKPLHRFFVHRRGRLPSYIVGTWVPGALHRGAQNGACGGRGQGAGGKASRKSNRGWIPAECLEGYEQELVGARGVMTLARGTDRGEARALLGGGGGCAACGLRYRKGVGGGGVVEWGSVVYIVTV
ncbi:hypothetical protein Tco_1533871 [Tanacetum coccineum]